MARGHRPGHASMGPRSCERGNSVGSPAKPNPGDGFNGAALVRARKFGFARADCQLWQASMGPRSCERGNAVIMGRVHILTISLQWGRARASAEIARHENALGLMPQRASMGPRSCERGNAVELTARQMVHKLQWGRARASAEILV